MSPREVQEHASYRIRVTGLDAENREIKAQLASLRSSLSTKEAELEEAKKVARILYRMWQELITMKGDIEHALLLNQFPDWLKGDGK
jgi:multidrug resistance efflux pump